MIAPGVVPPGVLFLTTPTAWRATLQTAAGRQVNAISIHALREEGDFHLNAVCSCLFSISIHALREEGDLRQAFQVQKYYEISIHALREEGDKKVR